MGGGGQLCRCLPEGDTLLGGPVARLFLHGIIGLRGIRGHDAMRPSIKNRSKISRRVMA
jgi:hypothetical protein